MIALARVISPKAKRVGWKRRSCSNHTKDTSAACWVRSTSSRRAASNRARHSGTPPPAMKAACSAIASSMASLVPEPMEKCAVALASPRRTTLPLVQRAQRIIGKRRQWEGLVRSRWPASSSRNTPSMKRAESASSMASSPARTKVFGSVSSTQVLAPTSYW